MTCDECGVNPAQIRIVSIVNGEKMDRNLCRDCMMKMQGKIPGLDIEKVLKDLNEKIAAQSKEKEAEQAQESAIVYPDEEPLDLFCPDCGTTYNDFRRTGRVGCVACYQVFKDPLTRLLTRVTGRSCHVGQGPQEPTGRISITMQLDRLKQELSEAIASEDYEKCAALRDQIHALRPASEGGSAHA